MTARLLRGVLLLVMLTGLVTFGHHLGLGWPLGVRASSDNPETAAVDATRVLRGPFTIDVRASGKLQARKTVTVRPQHVAEGAKLMWIAPDGLPIKKGDVVARLDDADLKRQVRDIGLEYANARADIEKTGRDRALEQRNSQAAVDKANEEMRILVEANKVQLKQAQAQVDFTNAEVDRLTSQYQRKKKQFEEKLIPISQVEDADIQMKSAAYAADKAAKDLKLQQDKAASTEQEKETDIANARFTVQTAQQRVKDDARSAETRLANIKQRLDEAEEKLSWCTIRATASGLLLLGKLWRGPDGRRVSRPGDRVDPQDPLATIPDLSVMAVECNVPERQIQAVQEGQGVNVRLEEHPERAYHGRIARVGSVAEEMSPEQASDFAAGTKVFTVTVELREHDPKQLMPGMNATIQIIARQIPDAVYVPKSCVFDRGADHVVYVRHGGSFDPVVVTPGEENATHVRILKGLRGGEWIATTDPTRIVGAENS
jgi:HlyD family secretion protein